MLLHRQSSLYLVKTCNIAGQDVAAFCGRFAILAFFVYNSLCTGRSNRTSRILEADKTNSIADRDLFIRKKYKVVLKTVCGYFVLKITPASEQSNHKLLSVAFCIFEQTSLRLQYLLFYWPLERGRFF